MMEKNKQTTRKEAGGLEAEVLQVPEVNQKLVLWHTVVCALLS